jgi:circadian clock protein KaiB
VHNYFISIFLHELGVFMREDLSEKGKEYELRLYISGETPGAKQALDNIKDICFEYLKGLCHIVVIDLSQHPEMASRKQIVAIPTLIKELPLPVRTIIGTLSEKEKVLVGLDIIPKQ